MRVELSLERRAEISHSVAHKLAFAFPESRAVIWAVVLLGSALTGIADWATGKEAWFGPVYMIFIGISAWSLGWLEALCLGLACMAMGLAANGLSLYPYGTVAAHWNVAMRVAAVLTVIGLLRLARRSYEREWRLARTDPLTGALNRQAFFELAGARHQSPAWQLIAFADLDGLKRLNDLHGHAAGDRCLKAYARHVRASIREDDIFVRLGGDEFLVYMSVRDEAAAKAVAARLHEGMNRAASSMDANLRCSIGVLILPPGPRSVERELKLADELMYEAKQRGAALMAATAHERRGTHFVCRHWELAHSYADDEVGQSGLETLDRSVVVAELLPASVVRRNRAAKRS